MDLLISAVIVVCVCILLFWIAGKIPDATLQLIAKIIIVAGGAIWLITHIRPIIHAIAGT